MDASHQVELINSRSNLGSCKQQCNCSICSLSHTFIPQIFSAVCFGCRATQFIPFCSWATVTSFCFFLISWNKVRSSFSSHSFCWKLEDHNRKKKKKTISVVPEKNTHTLVCRVVKRAKKRADAKAILEKCSSLRMPTTLLIGATHLFTCYFYVGMSVLMALPQKVNVCASETCSHKSKTAKKELLKRETHQILSDLNSHTTEPQGFCLISSRFSNTAIFFWG